MFLETLQNLETSVLIVNTQNVKGPISLQIQCLDRIDLKFKALLEENFSVMEVKHGAKTILVTSFHVFC